MWKFGNVECGNLTPCQITRFANFHISKSPELCERAARDGGVLKADAREIRDRDLRGAGSSRLAAGDDLAELGMHAIGAQPGVEGVAQLAERGALREPIDDEQIGAAEALRLQLLFPGRVRA